jgi:hypothetical protein
MNKTLCDALQSALPVVVRPYTTAAAQAGLSSGQRSREISPKVLTKDYKHKLRKQSRQSAGEQEVTASVILERYPICLPNLLGWREDFGKWQSDWNAWKFKTAKPGWLDCDQKVTDSDSPEVRDADKFAILLPYWTHPRRKHWPCARQSVLLLAGPVYCGTAPDCS